ncbi:nitrous oxide reductase family maturation protein NosD [Aureibaculum sp. 2210JD6-5]|uniref:nitrous oxide reductase family maturation protein NosD n=1 Tax=Aureibaculum sp. 2210JD6-5 TaxID=3103957 RepID=UPI002AAD59BB|nr:nitrous oxide reductase family maturation protein NosD [Aureibaculum sp. 2210JD6-5]MDY7396681.1 nitrous oxide reductase family maturation protein NosD [Aureibaculum sp. 2210JD6-5]
MFRILLLFICCFAFKGFGQAIEVCASCEVKTLTDAIAKSKPHGKVIVQKGTYLESDITIDKPLQIIGKDNPIIDGEKKSYVLIVKSDSVTVSGLTIKNPGQSYTKDYAAILISESNNFTFVNNTLENVFFGFLLEKSHHGIVSNNKVSSNAVDQSSSGNGIHLWNCSNITIDNNEVFDLRDGIYLEFVKESKVLNNDSHNNMRYGLHFMFSNENEYHNNTFTNNGAGVAVMFSKFIKMTGNTFTKNWGTASYGLLLKEIYDAEIENNTFEENTIGINVEGSTRINYSKNNFISNGWSVKIAGACYTNIFKGNNFLNNSFDISYNSKINDNKFDNNYWSSYTGYDLDKNGIGDIPYRPVKLFSYIVNKNPETIILMRSLFVDIINFSEKVSPVFTPDELVDSNPLMKVVK